MKPINKMNTKTDQQTARLDALISRIERHQKSQRLSDKQFAARYTRHIGSAKTWRHRLAARDWEAIGTRIEKWEGQLTRFVTELDGSAGAGDIAAYEIPILTHARLLYEQLQGQGTDRRFAIIIGRTGCGKSFALRTVHTENPRDTVIAEADETWKDNKTRCIEGLALAVGSPIKKRAADTFHALIEFLKARPLTILIDEFHEGGVLLMKLSKTIVNKTRAKILAGTYPTAWNRLTNGNTEAYAEAQQLFGRTIKPVLRIWDAGCTAADISGYLTAAIPALNGQAAALAEKILPDLRDGGNLRLLADAIQTAEANSAEDGYDIDADLIESAVAQLAAK